MLMTHSATVEPLDKSAARPLPNSRGLRAFVAAVMGLPRPKRGRKPSTAAKEKAKACKNLPGIEFLALDPCAYCGNPVATTHDHIEPVSRGGAHDLDNLTRCCWDCNFEKRTYSLLLFLAKRATKRHTDSCVMRKAAPSSPR